MIERIRTDKNNMRSPKEKGIVRETKRLNDKEKACCRERER